LDFFNFSNFSSGLTSEDDFSWSDSPWQKRRNPPGLSRSLCSKLYQASRQTTETLKVALQMITESQDTSDEDRLLEVESVNGDLIDEDSVTDFTESTGANEKSSEPGLGYPCPSNFWFDLTFQHFQPIFGLSFSFYFP
jgi:hypothetical protein